LHGSTSESPGNSVCTESDDANDIDLIDDMLARSPEERLTYLAETLRSLEALLAATNAAIPAE
jgi:hypothetical protein